MHVQLSSSSLVSHLSHGQLAAFPSSSRVLRTNFPSLSAKSWQTSVPRHPETVLSTLKHGTGPDNASASAADKMQDWRSKEMDHAVPTQVSRSATRLAFEQSISNKTMKISRLHKRHLGLTNSKEIAP